MKAASSIQVVKDPETFFPIVKKYFEDEGVINHLQAKFLVEVSNEVQKSKKQQLSPMKSKLIKKGVSSEFAMQFVLQYLLKKNLTFTSECGKTELPNVFVIYQTTTTIANKLKLRKPPSQWISETLFDHKERIKKINSPNTQENDFDIDFDSDDSKNVNNSNADTIENTKNREEKNIIEEEEDYSDDIVSIPIVKKKQILPKSNFNNLNRPKPMINNDFDFDSNSS